MTDETNEETVVEESQPDPPEEPKQEESQPQQKKRQKPEIVGVCSSCGSTNTKQYLEKNSFWRSGKSADCQFCGGVVVRAAKGSEDRAVERNRRNAGS